MNTKEIILGIGIGALLILLLGGRGFGNGYGRCGMWGDSWGAGMNGGFFGLIICIIIILVAVLWLKEHNESKKEMSIRLRKREAKR